MFDTPKIVEDTFDSRMPPEHYPKKRKEQLRTLSVDEQVTLRVDDLHKDIRSVHLHVVGSIFKF